VSEGAETVVRTSEPAKLRVVRRVREVYERREVLLNLVRKELKVKYTASVLGAVWSLLNPIVFLAVFSFVVKVTNNSFPHLPPVRAPRLERVLGLPGRRSPLGDRQRQPGQEGLVPS